ncbi:mandelate racemase/muconate lactonizing enzyme family protein [Glycomyces algeriensis]|uniref:Racemase n=1 Tax=Glycomyces algeriensis TaxID=256037 RepID=A0A9W6G8D2_9ACTN|nr:mandelate racemase/muconate lactonizing enzyme family protein [Glycomyces algeriensis]MDA1364390.1 mandelate racemase/muconate lactonizing enzyme family protein [Glycomyces algeriensis]MDR7350423.1 L-alanine-DL-glutamate epimerase-like enolase superfamily enzyme [Glycomyces algeriensis]GLI43130.1 racemase [Glycomyces algeriensis]
MRITGYRTLTTIQEWARPVGDANGVLADGVTTIPLVLVDTDEGLTGVGIGSHAEIAAVFAAIEGEDPRSVTALYDRMLRRTFKAGHGGAVFATIGALDTALWDLKAQAAEEPLWRFLGGRDRVVPAYASGLDIGLGDDELAAAYRVYAERGLRAAKLKGGLDVEADRRRLALVRDVLADAGAARPGLMLDANEMWSRKQAVRYVGELERTIDLAWVEEPVRRWDAEGLAVVQQGVRAAVATGENLTGLEQFRPLLNAGGVDIVQTSAVGGVTHFLRTAALAHAFDLPVSPIGNVPVGLLHAATAVPNHLVSELQDLRPPVGVTADLDIEDGAFVLGDTPGLGLTVHEGAITGLGPRPRHADPAGPGVRPERAGLHLLATPRQGDPTHRSPARRGQEDPEATPAELRVPVTEP